jgi:hypothetical protein
MVSDYIRHLPAGRVPLFRASEPRSAPTGQTEEELVTIGAELRARRREEQREAALRAEADAGAQQEIAPEGVTPPSPAAAPASCQQEVSTVKPQTNRPVLSHEQRCAERALFRCACNWLELHHLCANARCRKSGSCRGEAVACLRAAIPLVPESARQFVRGMIEGKELDLDFEEAFEDAGEFQDGWSAWIAGLQAAARRRSLPVRPRASGDPGVAGSVAKDLGPRLRGGERSVEVPAEPKERPKTRPIWP